MNRYLPVVDEVEATRAPTGQDDAEGLARFRVDVEGAGYLVSFGRDGALVHKLRPDEIAPRRVAVVPWEHWLVFAPTPVLRSRVRLVVMNDAQFSAAYRPVGPVSF